MTRFVLIPGAGGAASYWDRVAPLLRRSGHQVVAVELPGPDESAGLDVYADLVVAAAAHGEPVTVVAFSLGGFTASMVGERLPVDEMVLVNAMIPVPGETAEQWWEATGAVQAREVAAAAAGYGAFELDTYFMHDVDAGGLPVERYAEADAAFCTPCGFTAWPERVRALVGADDRFFPPDFQARIAQERLGLEADIRPGGHLIALAQPTIVADYLLQTHRV
jgi:pimeloyl-ACP methyl ester carboxylesterase